jgi:RNA-directed DNA polymerase
MKGCYQSTTTKQVAGFFEKDLRLSPDLAWKLAHICTFRGFLPTGSCLSPLLAYWAHRKTFDRIATLCDDAGITMTLYVDDLTFSGAHANLTFLHQVKRLLRDVGLKTHKDRSFAGSAFKHITGVAASPRGLHVPNKKLKKIVGQIDELATAAAEDRVAKVKQLAGGIASVTAISRLAGRALKTRRDRLASASSSQN